MFLKKVGVWLVRTVIIILIVSYIFSSVTLDFRALAKGVFEDVYVYADEDAQEQTIDRLKKACSSLNRGSLITLNQICTNETIMEALWETCLNYETIKESGQTIENEKELVETCKALESGEIKKSCEENVLQELSPDMEEFVSVCDDYKEDKIEDREFFVGVVSSPLGNQDMELPKMDLLDKYHQVTRFLNDHKIIYFVVLMILVSLLYFIIADLREFFIQIGDISMSIGFIILLPYLIALLYDKFVGIDTTPILSGIFGGGFSLNVQVIVTSLMLMFLRIYSGYVLVLGIVFLAVGLGLKVYKVMSKVKEHEVKEEKSENHGP